MVPPDQCSEPPPAVRSPPSDQAPRGYSRHPASRTSSSKSNRPPAGECPGAEVRTSSVPGRRPMSFAGVPEAISEPVKRGTIWSEAAGRMIA
jgi:hypothetical protein